MLLLKYSVPLPPNRGTACPATAVLRDHPAAVNDARLREQVVAWLAEEGIRARP